MQQKEDGHSFPSPRVIIAHPHALIREALSKLIEGTGFHVADEVGDVDSLLASASEIGCDIAIIDFRLAKSGGDLIDRLKDVTGGVVAIIANPEDIEEAPGAIEAGAKGYLSYSQTGEEFIQSLSLLSKGTVIVSSAASDKVKSSINKPSEVDSAGITGREKDVVVLVAQGATNREIANRLMVSQHTVKIHLHSILSKLNLRNRQQIAAFAIKQGLLEDIHTEDFSRRE